MPIWSRTKQKLTSPHRLIHNAVMIKASVSTRLVSCVHYTADLASDLSGNMSIVSWRFQKFSWKALHIEMGYICFCLNVVRCRRNLAIETKRKKLNRWMKWKKYILWKSKNGVDSEFLSLHHPVWCGSECEAWYNNRAGGMLKKKVFSDLNLK